MKEKIKCSFCNDDATTKDHTPSRNWLEKPYPDNLFTIPACLKCNRSFSLDEEYFLNVLVEISTSRNLISKKEEGGNVFKAREYSPGLKMKIENSLIKAENGKVYFKSEYNRIKRVIEKNALGLYFRKYNKIPNLSLFNCTGFYPFTVVDLRPDEVFLLTYSEKFIQKKWTTIQKDVFSYIVVRDWRRGNQLTMIFHIHNSVWCVVEIPNPRSIKDE